MLTADVGLLTCLLIGAKFFEIAIFLPQCGLNESQCPFIQNNQGKGNLAPPQIWAYVHIKGGAVYRLPFLPLFFDRFYRFTVYRFFAQKAVKNGKNFH